MKSIVTFFCFLLLAFQSFGQINLVPNPSFEDTLYCPTFIGEIEPANHWLNFGNSADYFNSCNSGILNVPNEIFGYQLAHSGNALAGLITYVWQFSPAWPNYREYVGVELHQPLVIGQRYYFSYYFNLAGYLPGYQIIAANKIGLKFSTVVYSENNPPPLTNSSTFYTDSIVTDTVNWIRLSGSFISDSAYTHLIIGNFFDDSQTDTIIFGGAPFGSSSAYYFIDDVCVTADSVYNQTWTQVLEPKNNDAFFLYPNPSTDIITVNAPEGVDEVSICDLLGKQYYKCTNIEFQHIIDVRNFHSGNYIVQINLNGIRINKLINILH